MRARVFFFAIALCLTACGHVGRQVARDTPKPTAADRSAEKKEEDSRATEVQPVDTTPEDGGGHGIEADGSPKPAAPTEPSLLSNATLGTLLRRLHENPGIAPITDAAPAIGVLLSFVARSEQAPGNIRLSPLRSPNLRSRLAAARDRATRPHSWLFVVDSTTGKPLYWTAVENPFVHGLETVDLRGSGYPVGSRGREGIVSSVLVFEPRACVAWLEPDGAATLVHPDAFFCFGDRPTAPVTRGVSTEERP